MRIIRKLAIASVSVFALAAPAMAQDAAVAEEPAEVGFDSGEIVVQARRRDESVQDVPAVVNAVTSASIDKLNIRRLEDVASVVPGLAMTGNSNGIGSTTSIRGVQHDVIASGDAGTVQYYYNEAPVSSAIVLGSMYDVELVEVLRGPQGTLKGRASPSGSISITFRRPDLDEVGGYAMGTVNDIDGYNVNGAMNLPIIEGKLGLRIAGLVSDDDGNNVHALTNSRPLKNRTEAGRISLRADPFDGVFLVDASYSTVTNDIRQYTQVESMDQVVDGIGASPVTIRAKDRLAVNRIPTEVRQRIQNYNVNAQLNAYGQRLVYVGNWARQNIDGTDATRGGDRAGLFESPYALQYDRAGAVVQPETVIPFSQPNSLRAAVDTHELRLQNNDRVAGMFDYVVGFLSYKIDSPTSFQEVSAGRPGPGGTLGGVVLTPLQRFNNSSEKSVFGNVTAHIGDRAELSGGVRHIWFESDAGVRGCTTNFGTCVEIPSLGVNEKDEATIFSVSGKYEFTDDLMGYVSYGTSWRPRTMVIGGPTAPSTAQQAFLGSPPEKSKSVEAGIKSSWLNNRLRLNVTAFYQEFDNYAYRSPGIGVYAINFADLANQPVRAYNFISAVPIEVKGVEADLSFAVTPNWSVSGNVSYADGKIKNGNIPCLDLNGDGVPDAVTGVPSLGDMQAATGADGISVCNVTQRANSTSPWSFTLQSEYSRPLSDSLDGFVRGLYTWKGNALGDPQNVYDSVESYGLLNLYAGVRDADGAWEIMAYGKNLTNTFRVLSRSNGPETTNMVGSGPISTNYFAITSTQPREFGITARFAFGSR